MTVFTRFARWFVTLAHALRVELGFRRCDLDGHVWATQYVDFDKPPGGVKRIQVERVCQYCLHTEREWT